MWTRNRVIISWHWNLIVGSKEKEWEEDDGCGDFQICKIKNCFDFNKINGDNTVTVGWWCVVDEIITKKEGRRWTVF